MTRRLVVALVVFTTFVLLLSVVPLGWSTAQRDRSDYAAQARSSALSLAALAADSFDDHGRRLTPARLASAAGRDVSVRVIEQGGREVLAAGVERIIPPPLIARALAGRTVSTSYDDRVIAAAPVVADGVVRGAVLTSRSDEAVERRIARLWLLLSLVAAIALLLSVALAVATARWVGLPLRRLQETAHHWSDGSLHERANTSTGPPEVRQVAVALNALAGRLDTLLHGSRAVVADVSHQLRTPLAAMRLRLELVRGELPNEPGGAADDLGLALAEVDRLSRLVDGLLAVARAESAQARAVPVDVAAVMQDRRVAWQPVAAERGVAVELTAPNQPVLAMATEGHLEQVVDNLLDNAIEAMPDGGCIELLVERQRENVVVVVRDDGPGMAPEQQESAFHRFVSGRQSSGSGLGLAVVHRLVTADGGTVDLTSAPGVGTTVTVVLPAAR